MSLSQKDIDDLTSLLSKVKLAPNVPLELLGDMQEALDTWTNDENSAESLMYCFKLCDLTVTDGSGNQFYLVKIGKCECKTYGKTNATAPASLCYRFAEHKRDLSKAFGRELKIFAKKTELTTTNSKGKQKVIDCLLDTMTVANIREATLTDYVDFCCIIEGTNEKLLKKTMPKINFAPLKKFAEAFAWTEVRLMLVDDFNTMKAMFLDGKVTLKSFIGGLTTRKVDSKTLSMDCEFTHGTKQVVEVLMMA